MRRFSKLVAALAALQLIPAMAYGINVTISLVESGTGNSVVYADPGDTIVVSVLLSTDTPLDGIQYSLSADNGGNVWILTDASQPPAWINGAVFALGDYMTTIGTNPAALGVTLAAVDTIGPEAYFTDSGTTAAPLMDALVANYELHLAMAIPDGTYLLSANGDSAGWGNGVIYNDGVDFAEWNGGSGLSIIVPDPALGWLLLGMLPLLRRRRKV